MVSGMYLLVLTMAATRGARRPAPRACRPHRIRFLVVIPAHNEDDVIASTIAAVRASEYPSDLVQIAVIADNCSDETAVRARAAGALVMERTDPARRGKGHALAWGLARLEPRFAAVDAVVLLDADCTPSGNCLAAMEARIVGGASAVQVSYVVANADESPAAGLRFAAFALMNYVRPLGKATLGQSCGMLGTGYCSTVDLLRRHPWDTHSLSEDHDYDHGLVARGERIEFAPEAEVTSPMPTSFEGSRAQQLRWEAGKWELVRRWTVPHLRAALRHRRLRRLWAAFEPLVLPQALLAAGNGVTLLAAAATGGRAARGLAAWSCGAQVLYVIGGLLIARAPAAVWRALFRAPQLVAFKVGVYLQLLLRGRPKDWVGTRSGTAG